MPAGFVSDPSSPQAESAWRESVEQRFRQGKNNSQIIAPALRVSTAALTGVTGTNAVPGCTATVIVPTRRIIELHAELVVQMFTVKSAIQVFLNRDGGTLWQSVESIDGTTSDYATISASWPDETATVDTHTYALVIVVQPAATATVLAGEAFLSVKDGGLAAP